MMKQIVFAAFALMTTVMSFPQDARQGPPKPPPPEKRWEKDSEKIKKEAGLTDPELSRLKTPFMSFYKEMDELHEKNKDQRPPKEAVDKLREKRNEAIRKVISKDKYDKFMKVEKELGPPKPKDRPE